jgi:hypothetical protein
MICRCGWSELLAVAELVTTHVIEVLVCIVPIDELLSVTNHQVSLWCQIYMHNDSCISLALTIHLGRQRNRPCDNRGIEAASVVFASAFELTVHRVWES